ncbi:MFS transporter [Nocardioides jejuensis]|uniref:MFS transporter n=1 Tax=Nocardioides jejuensis TaxID=2502782 RepID=A0A4R1CHA2_9ACTN|nr:MFS transporter [Nocardioides jejuensis]TCJ30640.1 MFS transporter [Nocardioides jejuensis]
MNRKTMALLVLKVELFAFFVAAAAPSPLLVPFQHDFGFSAAMLTVIFATYAVALMVALLIAGGLSDHIGRRPVIIGTLLLESAAMLVFLSAQSVEWLLAGRALQGVATGVAVGALNAAILEAAPEDSRLGALINGFAPLAGLAAGGVVTGLLIQKVSDPATTTFIVLAAFFGLGAMASVRLPETSRMRPGTLRSLIPRMSLPHTARATFLSLVPGLIALWATSGLYLSLIPVAMREVFDVKFALAGGLAIGLLNASGAVAPLLLRRYPASLNTVLGSTALLLGAGLAAASVLLASAPTFLVATVMSGAGFGLAFSASPRQVMEFVPADQRASTFASIYVVSYVAFSVPAVLAGVLVHPFGLDDVLLGYAAAVMVAAGLGVVTSLRERAREQTTDVEVLAA